MVDSGLDVQVDVAVAVSSKRDREAILYRVLKGGCSRGRQFESLGIQGPEVFAPELSHRILKAEV